MYNNIHVIGLGSRHCLYKPSPEYELNSWIDTEKINFRVAWRCRFWSLFSRMSSIVVIMITRYLHQRLTKGILQMFDIFFLRFFWNRGQPFDVLNNDFGLKFYNDRDLTVGLLIIWCFTPYQVSQPYNNQITEAFSNALR